jgi:hypothetical protein
MGVVHPLDRSGYEAITVKGGATAPARPWEEFPTWDALRKNDAATATYFRDRAAAIDNPNLDWSEVLDQVLPKLAENREFIGIASLKAPGSNKLRLVAIEASPTDAGDNSSETAFAGIPSNLVVKYASRPGLILFHTHPADVRGSPLPSSHDLSTAIYLGATSRFAACAVISRYGVLMHGLGWEGYKAINEASDWKLAVLNLSHDVVAAHEATRSWSTHGLADYLSFYPRHRLFMFVYPSPEMVGDLRRVSWMWDLETPIDHEVISEHASDISRHRASQSNKKKMKKAAKFASDFVGVSDLKFD